MKNIELTSELITPLSQRKISERSFSIPYNVHKFLVFQMHVE